MNGATPGLLDYSSRGAVAVELSAAAAANAPLDARLMEVGLDSVKSDPELLSFATAGGGAIFRNNCSQCHGAGGGGTANIYPNLLDDDWLWGGTVADIATTVTHGIRYEADPDTRYSQMPAFGGVLEADQIDEVLNYVLSLSGANHDSNLAARGASVFADNCSSCHGEDGKGGREVGAPNLTDQIWLYGGSPDTIRHTIRYARFGVMPAFQNRLSTSDLIKVAVYVNTLGGGEN